MLELNHRFGVSDIALRVQNSLRAGWYFRVVQPGSVSAFDELCLVERPHPNWSVDRLLALIRDRTCDKEVLRKVLHLPLTASWRKLFSRLAEMELVEDWGTRLNGKRAV